MYVRIHMSVDFGAILVWIGIYIFSVTAFTTLTQQLLALISPLFIALLLIYISGIPMLEKAGVEKWGDDKAYKAYKKNTPVLIPYIGRKGDAAF